MRSGPRPKAKNKIAGLCKGSTTDSDSVCEGSNPSSATISKKSIAAKESTFLFYTISSKGVTQTI